MFVINKIIEGFAGVVIHCALIVLHWCNCKVRVDKDFRALLDKMRYKVFAIRRKPSLTAIYLHCNAQQVGAVTGSWFI